MIAAAECKPANYVNRETLFGKGVLYQIRTHP